ncbi:hypothetical protein ABL386_004395 [Escherichia coli]|jgi:hypothetical protein|uniref:hypothetical protein n=1 Tax=Enterobacteriaceae TaxID=543 RepID=UPI0006A08B88|nr:MULTISPECIES: hypothetical protein [Enterobacteriaceae]EFO2111850.1 hypothetical protein [Escherichia coli O106]EFA6089830.1 hypothetical protein [Escherichia coli]EFC2193754.1 hypothetical protein [Escherichia coli]EFH3313401.1 hypothetical protein [Escherichia coli]EFK3807283.1 hypothetical protein [Escherichia coli]
MSNSEYMFYAIIDDEDGLVSVAHEKYGEVKAVFRTKEDAQRAIDLQDDENGLRIRKCEIVQA